MNKVINSIVAACVACVSCNAIAAVSNESTYALQELQRRLTHVLTTEVRSASVRQALQPLVTQLGQNVDTQAGSVASPAEGHIMREFLSNIILMVEERELDETARYDLGTVAGYAAECMPWEAWRAVEEFCRVTANYERVDACEIMAMTIAYEKLMPCPRYYRRRVLTDYPHLWRADAYEPPYVPPAWFMRSVLETVRRVEQHAGTQGAQLIWGPLANMLDDYFIQRSPHDYEEWLATEASTWIKQRMVIALTYHPTRDALALYEKYYASAYPHSTGRERRRAIALMRERVEQEEARQRSYTGVITSEVQAVATFRQQQAAWDAKLNAMPIRTAEEADAFEAALLQYEARCRDAGRSDWYRPDKYTSRLCAVPAPQLKEWYWRAMTQCVQRSDLTVTHASLALAAGAAFGAVLEEADCECLIRLNNALGTWDVIERMTTRDDSEESEWRSVTKLAVLSAFGSIATSGRTNVAAALARRRMEIFDKHVREQLAPFAGTVSITNR